MVTNCSTEFKPHVTARICSLTWQWGNYSAVKHVIANIVISGRPGVSKVKLLQPENSRVTAIIYIQDIYSGIG